MLKNVHWIMLDRISIKIKRNLLGTMGKRAPFRSHKQNMTTTTILAQRGARTIGEVHGKVTPPYNWWNRCLNNKRGEKNTQMRGRISNAHARRDRIEPRMSIARSFLHGGWVVVFEDKLHYFLTSWYRWILASGGEQRPRLTMQLLKWER